MKKGIVWLASYPKSGNTLLRLFLSHYIYGNGGKLNVELLKNILKFESKECFSLVLNNKNLENNFLYIKHCIDVQKRLIKLLPQNKLVFKTHHFFGDINGHKFTNKENTLGFIFLIRDPREVLVSYSHHANYPLDKLIKIMTQKDAISPNGWETRLNWSQQYRSWQLFESVPSLFIKYEDLVSYKFEVFRLIINFLSSLINVEYNKNKISEIIKIIEFSKLQKLEKEKGFFESAEGRVFFRSGKFDSWKNILTQQQKNKIEYELQDTMKKFGYI